MKQILNLTLLINIVLLSVNYTFCQNTIKKNESFYSIQIGCFKYIDSIEIKGITPLLFENAYGFTRCLAGKYTDYKLAKQARYKMQKIGIFDAFVVAYYNGKRIATYGEALKIPGFGNKNEPIVIKRNYKYQEKLTINFPDFDFIKIQIGVFEFEPPDSLNIIFNKIVKEGYTIKKDSSIYKGFKVYFIDKEFKEREKAYSFCEKIREIGIEDSFCVYFNEKKKVYPKNKTINND